MVQGNSTLSENQTFNAMDNSSIELPEGSAFADMEMSREGQDLILQSNNGQDFVIENYFSADPAPTLENADGSVLTPELVEAFVQSPEHLAQIETAAGTEPVGAIEELHGEATVTRTDGSSEPVTLGTPIYQGDIVETSADGGVNILFVDETSMALSEGARFAVKDYSFDAETESGTTDFSVLRGVFVFTSGLIGRDDPDDVTIDTPVGSIGIRGTIIAGNINPEGESTISVVEGAIVIKNGAGERTLSEQFETITINGFNSEIQDIGVLEPAAVTNAYGSASYVIPSLFSNINDAAKEKAAAEEQTQEEILEAETLEETKEEIIEEPVEELMPEMMQEPVNQSLEFKLMQEQNPIEMKRMQRIKMRIAEQQQEKEPIDDLQNPDVIANAQTPEFTIVNRLTENEQSGGIVARLITNKFGTQFTFANGTDTSADNNFQIIGNNIVLTSDGYISLNSLITGMTSTGFDTSTLWSNYAIRATGPDGQTVMRAFNPVIEDIGINLNGNGQGPYENGLVNLGNMNRDSQNIDDLASINGSGDVVINSGLDLGQLYTTNSTAIAFSYTSLAALGDYNNDGYADAIAGSAGSNGVALLYGGSLSIDDSAGLAQAGGLIGGENYGSSVSGAGDFDGNGQLDYIVGAPDANGGAGRVYLHYDGGSNDIQIDGNGGEQLGNFVAGVGDTNGDGLSDILIGGNNQSQAYLIYGTTSPGVLNGITTSTLGGSGTTIDVSGTGQMILTGGNAGDFNGDGYSDMIISTTNGADVKNFVVFGGNTLPSTIDMAYLENPDNAFKINDVSGFDANYTVRSVGDVNGDGFDDVEVGSVATGFYIVNGGLQGNVAYATDNSTYDASALNDYVQANADNLALVGARAYADGNQINISMQGDARDNNAFRINNNQFRSIDGGEGNGDTIRFGLSTPGTLDFSTIEYEQISGIERIQLAQYSGNTVTLTVENIFNLLKTSDTGELKIELGTGVASGSLDIVAAGTYANTATGVMNALDEQGGIASTYTTYGTFDQYDIGGYTLYIDQGITTATV